MIPTVSQELRLQIFKTTTVKPEILYIERESSCFYCIPGITVADFQNYNRKT